MWSPIVILLGLILSLIRSQKYVSPTHEECYPGCDGSIDHPFDSLYDALLKVGPIAELVLLNDVDNPHYFIQDEITSLGTYYYSGFPPDRKSVV